MQVSVERTEGLERRMVVQVPADRLEGEVQSRLQNLARTVRLDGFRPGKVPFKVVQKRFGAQVRQEVVNDVLQQTYGEALRAKELNPAGAPSVDVRQGERGGDLEYEAVFEVMPEFEVKGAEGMKLKRPVATVDDAAIDRVLEDLRKQQATYEPVEREAQADDRVIVDFTGTVDGEGFPGSDGEDQPVTIGSNTMPPEFEEALKGLKAGDTKRIEYTFNEDFPTTEIAGKTAVFETTVKAVEEPRLPELDDALAEAVGIREGGMKALRGLVRGNLDREAERASRERLKEQVVEGLATANELELPRALVDGEIDALRQQMKQRLQSQLGEDSDPDLPADLFEGQARRRVTLGLVMNELVREKGIRLDQDRVKQQMQEIASGYERPQEIMEYYRQNRQLIQSLEVSVLEDQVIDWIIEQADVEDEPTDLQELLNPTTRQAGTDAESGAEAKSEE